MATTCANAINIPSAPVTNQALVCGAGNDLSATTVPAVCGAASNSYKGGNEALYTYTAAVTGGHTISYSGQTWTSIFVYAGCPTSGGTCVGSIGTSTSSKSLVASMTAGITYYIWFDTWPTPNSPCPGTFSLSPPLACPTPTATAATLIASQQAQANWTCVGCTGSFIVEYGPSATFTTPGTGLTPGANGTILLSGVGTTNALITGLTPSTQYRYFVRQDCNGSGNGFGINSAGITFTTTAPPPPNDLCSGAIPITCASSPVSGTSLAASQESVPNCGAGNTGLAMGVWYSYSGDNQQVTINTCATPGYDTRLTVYEGSCGGLVCVTGNDDDNTCTVSGLRSRVQWNALTGTTYFIMVHAWASGNETAQGNFVLNVSCTPLCLPVPSNDACANAQALTVNTVTPGFNTCADASIGNPTCESAFATLPDVFYTFTATQATMYLTLENVTTTGTNLGYAVYSACGGTELFCNGAVTSGFTNVLNGLTIGSTYTIRVETDQVNVGDFTIRVWEPCEPNGTATVVENCGAGNFTIDVNITSLGNGTSVGVEYTVGAGTPVVIPGQGLGITTIPAQTSGSVVLVRLLNEQQSGCDRSLGTRTDCCNGTCAGAATLTGPGLYFAGAMDCGAGASNAGATGAVDARWFKFTPPNTGIMSVYTCAPVSTADTRLTIHTGTCGSLTVAGFNDDGCGLQSQVLNLAVTGGTTYFIEWDDRWSSAAAGHNFQLDYVDCTPPTATAQGLDDCGAGTFGATINITNMGSSPAFNVVATPGGVVASNIGPGVTVIPASSFPAGSPVNLTLVSTTSSNCTLNLGNFTDCCSGQCVSAIPAVLGTNTCPAITCGGGATNAFATGATNARWFSYTATGFGYLNANSCAPLNPSGIDSRVSLHKGTCGSLTFLNGDDDGCTTPTFGSNASVFVEPGDEIYIEWDDRWSQAGFTWDLNFTPCTPPASNLCSNQDPTLNQLNNGDQATYSALDVNCTSDDVGIASLFGAGTTGYGWISFELLECADVVIDYCGTVGAFTNGSLNMYADCGGVNVVNSQTFNFTTCVDGRPSIFYNSLPPGQYYYPVLSGATWTNNVFTLHVTANPPVVSCTPNTSCEAAPILCFSPVSGTTVSNFATQGPSVCLPNHTAPGPDAWYLYGGQSAELDIFSGDGSTTTFTLGGSPATVNNVALSGPATANYTGDGVETGFDVSPGLNPVVSSVTLNGSPQTLGDGPTNLVLTLITDQFGGETSWQLENSVPAVIASGSGYASNTTIVVPIGTVPNGLYTFTIFDSFGDGMCCAYGNGSYSLANASSNTVLASGGAFGASEATGFSINAVPGDYYISPGTGGGGADEVVFNTAPAIGDAVVINYTADQTLTDPTDYGVSVGTGGGGEDQIVLVVPPASGQSVTVNYGLVAGAQLLTASTCVGTNYNSMITVYEADPNDCNNLVCITGNDDNCGVADGGSQVNWISTPGTSYYIAVHGPNGFVNSTGNFTLELTCAAPCTPQANDVCATATPVTPVFGDGTGVAATFDNTCSFADANPSCSVDNTFVPNAFRAQGVWFSFNSTTNNFMNVTLLNDDYPPFTATALSYALYDACGGNELACVTAGEGTTALPALTLNTDYQLMVYNTGGPGVEGTFGLLMEFPAQNDAAIDAITSPVGNLCASAISPVVVLRNNGQQPLTSVTITYNVDGGTPVVYNWTGNLTYGQTASVTLPTSITSAGFHFLNVSTSLPNGVADELPGNDAFSDFFTVDGEEMDLVINTDQFGSETTWEIRDLIDVPVASGGPYAGNTTIVETLCLPLDFGSCWSLYMFDSFGDGMCCSYGLGSWEIRDPQGRLLLTDLFHGSGTNPDGTTAPDGAQSPASAPASAAYNFGHEFCLPAGPAAIQPGECGIYTNNLQAKVYWQSVPGVTTYQAEFSDPDAGFRRRIQISGRNWVKFSEMVTSPLLPGTYYFARVRADQGNDGFFNDNWGPGCNMAIDPSQVPGCTQLIDNIGLPTHSCGVTKQFNGSDKVWAQPVVSATQYRFRFVNTGEGFVRQIARPGYICLLSWTTLPLQNGITYDVSVECLVNGQWSGFCGAICQVTINNPPAFAAREMAADAVSNDQVSLWPNPVRDGQVNLLVEGILDPEQRIAVEVTDMFGKRVLAQQYNNSGEVFNTILELDGLAAGIYAVNITINDRTTTQQIAVQ